MKNKKDDELRENKKKRRKIDSKNTRRAFYLYGGKQRKLKKKAAAAEVRWLVSAVNKAGLNFIFPLIYSSKYYNKKILIFYLKTKYCLICL